MLVISRRVRWCLMILSVQQIVTKLDNSAVVVVALVALIVPVVLIAPTVSVALIASAVSVALIALIALVALVVPVVSSFLTKIAKQKKLFLKFIITLGGEHAPLR
jgi:hypothetical protein